MIVPHVLDQGSFAPGRKKMCIRDSPLLAPFLSEELGDEVVLIDAGRETALACARSLEADDALNLTKKRGTCRFYVSDCPDDFSHVARIFLGREVEDDVERVDIDSLLK